MCIRDRQCADELLSTYDHDIVRIAGLYQRVLKRIPSPEEISESEGFLERARAITEAEDEVAVWQSLCRILMSTNEFVYVE